MKVCSKAFLTAICAAVLAASLLPSSQAHARMIRAKPADKSEIETAPKQVDFWFNELLEDGLNKVEVYPASEASSKQRENLCDGKPKLDPKDKTHLFVALHSLPPGQYIAEYRVLSRDGHSAPGRITFTVKASE